MRRQTLLTASFILSILFVAGLIPAIAGAVETRLTTGGTDQFQPDIEGDKVIWIDGINYVGSEAYSDVWLHTIGGASQKINSVKKAHSPALSTGMAVWEDLRNDAGGAGLKNTDVYGFALPSGPEAAVNTDTAPQLAPAVSGTQVVWQAFDGAQWDIWLKKTDGSVVQLTNDADIQEEPRIDGDKVVWTDRRNGNQDIYIYNITSGVETRITDNGANQYEPDISGNLIVWRDARGANNNIYYYDLGNPVANGAPVSANGAAQHGARVSGSRVVWTDWRNGSYIGGTNSDIYSFDFSTGVTRRLTSDGSNQNSPAISGNRIVWTDYRYGNWDVFMDEPDTVAPTASISAPAISTRKSKNKSFKVTWSGSDPAPASGLKSYDVKYKVGSAGTWINWKSGTTATSAVFTGAGGKTYYFYVRARDNDGNLGAWTGPATTVVPYDQSKRIAKRRGFVGILSKASTSFYLGTVRYSTNRGDTLVYGFNGKKVTVISTKGKNRSKAKVFIDGKYKKTIDTRAKRLKYRQEVYSFSWASSGKHTVKIVNLATPGRGRLDVDALAVEN